MVTRHFGGTEEVTPTWTRIGWRLARLIRKVWGPRLDGWFHRGMHESVVATGRRGGCASGGGGCVTVAVVARVVRSDTVAPAFLLSFRPKINSAARKPTVRAR